MKATCMGCGITFETDRTDAIFHDGACKARTWRAIGKAGDHAHLDHIASKHCEFCGNMFWFNAYAQRGGKRVPTYCRDACRVAAHRARSKAAKQREQTAQRDRQSWEAAQKRAKTPPPPPPPQYPREFRDTLKPPSRWTKEAAYMWLGVTYGSSQEHCAKRMRDLNRQYHPDVNGGAVWPHLAIVNAAYDFLKRKVFA